MSFRARENRRLEILFILLIISLLVLLAVLMYRSKKEKESALELKPFDGHIGTYDENLGGMSLNPWNQGN